jgi:hypothetical protein
MRNERLNDTNLSAFDDELEQRLIRALETRPVAAIPADFAARVAGKLPARRPIVLTPTHYGRRAMIVCMVVLGVALLLAFALRGVTVAPMVRVTGWLLYVQFLGLVVWFGMRGSLRKLR